MKKINTIKPQEGRSRDWLPAGKKEQHQMPSLLKAASLLSTSKKYFKVKPLFITPPPPLFHGHWPWGSTRSTFTTEMHRATPRRSFTGPSRPALLFWNNTTWWKHSEGLCFLPLCSLCLCLLQEVWRLLLLLLKWERQHPWNTAVWPSSEIQMKINRQC